MSGGRFAIVLVALANLVPLVVGAAAYPVLHGSLGQAYVSYTLVFWVAAAVALYALNRKSFGAILQTLSIDLERRSLGRFLVFLAFVLIGLNLDWLGEARAAGLDNREIRFKLFFLFEDLLFVAFAVVLWRAAARLSFTRLAVAAALGVPMLVVFGRFGAIAGFLLMLLLLKVGRPGPRVRPVAGLLVVAAATVAATGFVEWTRLEGGGMRHVGMAFTDRVGEISTLLVADRIMASEQFDRFAGFGRLRYLYAPSTIFPEKPPINDGAEYMRTRFGLGSGESGTRFPILLHLDSYRRFGWAGLGVAILPALLLRVLTSGAHAMWRRFGVPFLPIVMAKHFIFVYPKSVLGLIEICLYTIPRSGMVMVAVFVSYDVLVTVGRRAPARGPVPSA